MYLDLQLILNLLRDLDLMGEWCSFGFTGDLDVFNLKGDSGVLGLVGELDALDFIGERGVLGLKGDFCSFNSTGERGSISLTVDRGDIGLTIENSSITLTGECGVFDLIIIHGFSRTFSRVSIWLFWSLSLFTGEKLVITKISNRLIFEFEQQFDTV